MWIAKNNDLIILAKNTKKELQQALKFMVYTDIENSEYNYELYNGEYKTAEEIIALRQSEFLKEFFLTSLGYIRRSVSMADGGKKDFLSDLLPVISMGVQAGQEVKVIAYTMPDFTEEVTDWTQYQHVETVTPQFVQECFLQLSNDFLPDLEEKNGN